MTETPPTLTIVIPTYNERERIAEIVTDVFSECERAGVDLEVIDRLAAETRRER